MVREKCSDYVRGTLECTVNTFVVENISQERRSDEGKLILTDFPRAGRLVPRKLSYACISHAPTHRLNAVH